MTFARVVVAVVWTYLIAPSSFAHARNERFSWDCRKVERKNWSSIAESKFLSANERALLTKAVAAQLRGWSLSAIGIDSEEALQKTAAETLVKAVDLGENGGREFLARGGGQYFCSPTGNCEAWVFRLHDGMYSLMLHRTATQTFTIQPTKTSGFHDLVLGQHGSATEQGLTLYRFDGSRYRRTACYDARFTFLGKDGEYHDRKEPILTPEICAFR